MRSRLTKAVKHESSGVTWFSPEDSAAIQGRPHSLFPDDGELWYCTPDDSQSPLVPDPPVEEAQDEAVPLLPLFATIKRVVDFLFPKTKIDVRRFMDGKNGRPRKRDWIADQTIDVTAAIQEAIDSQTSGYTVEFPGPGVYKFKTIHISDKTNLTICGSGTVDGLFYIHNTAIPKENPLNIVIDGLQWDRGRPDYDDTGILHEDGNSNKNAIQLEYCAGIKITKCHFVGVDKCIYVSPHNVFQHVSKLTISKCSTGRAKQKLYRVVENNGAYPFTYQNRSCPNYFLYIDNSAAGTTAMTMGVGDTTIVGCNPLSASVCQIYAQGADGLLIQGNTMFLPGGYYRSGVKTHNIFAEYSNWCIISGNALFESGTESVLLHWATNYIIKGNNIAWPGQRDGNNGWGIRVTGGGIFPAGNRYSRGTIVANGICQPTKGGIRIDAGQDIVTISSNTTTSAGSNAPYYGDGTQPQGPSATPPINSIAHYGISVSSECYGITVIGNNNPENANDLPKCTLRDSGGALRSGPIDIGNFSSAP